MSDLEEILSALAWRTFSGSDMEPIERDHPGWEKHEAEQRERWLRLTPLERLRWLDGAKRFAALAATAAQGRDPSVSAQKRKLPPECSE